MVCIYSQNTTSLKGLNGQGHVSAQRIIPQHLNFSALQLFKWGPGDKFTVLFHETHYKPPRRSHVLRLLPTVTMSFERIKTKIVVQRDQPPEVARTPLEQLCLTVKTRFGMTPKLHELLARMLTPPPPTATASAVTALTRLGGLDEAEGLTPLGRLLSRVPMDPRLAKTCIFACMLRSAVCRNQCCKANTARALNKGAAQDFIPGKV